MAGNSQKANVIVTMDGKQAEKVLESLEKTAKNYRKEIEQIKDQPLLSQEDLSNVRQLEKDLRQTNRAIKEVQTQTKDVSSIISDIAGATEKQLGDAYRTLIKQTKNLDRSTQEYAENRRNIALLKQELDKINQTGTKQVTMWDQLGKTIKRLASYVLVYFGFNKLTEGLQAMASMNIELSDQLSDIQKTTGLAGSALAELSNDINRIDTRTSVEQLNKLAYEAGKLGMSAKEDVLGFVRAGNQINVALGEDLGEDAIKNIAKLNNVLGITKRLGVEQALLSTGSAINELGQSSTASEGYLVDFAQRLGGIAAQSGLTVQQVLALGSATDQLGQNVEVSATALNRFIVTTISKTEQVAKALQIPLQDLRSALDRSTWEGIMLVFQKMSERGGLSSLAPIMGDLGSEGARLTAVLSALSANTDIMTREIEIANKAFAEATSITQEYNVRNENLAANVEKIGKNIRRWFLGSGLVDWMAKVTGGIERWTRANSSSKESFEGQLAAVRDLNKNISPLLDEYERLKDTEAGDEQERLRTIVNQIGSALPGAVSQWDKYGNALSINTERAKALIKQEQILLKFRNKEAIESVEKNIKRLEFEQKLQKDIVEEMNTLGSYTDYRYVDRGFGPKVRESYTVTDPEKLDIQKEKWASINIELEQQQNLLSSLTGDYLNEYGNALETIGNDLPEPTTVVDPEETAKQAKERIKNQLAAIDAYIDAEKTALIRARVNREDYRSEVIDSEQKYNSALEQIEFEGLEKRLAVSGLSNEKQAELQRQFWDFKLRLFTTEEKSTQKFLNDLDKLYDQFELKSATRDQRELIRIRQKYNDATLLLDNALKKNLISEEEYQRLIEQIREKGRLAEDQYYSNQGAKDAATEIKRINEAQSQAELQASEMRIQGVYNESQYKARLLEIEMQYQEQRLRVNGLTEEQITELKRQNADRQIQILDQASRRQEQIQQQYADVVRTTASSIGESFGKLFEDSADVWKSFGDSMIDVAFDTMMRLVDIWLKEMQAKAIIDTAKGASQEIGSKGLLGVVTAAAIGGVIQGFLQVAKAGIKSLIGKGSTGSNVTTGQRVVKSSGFAVGGDTGPGSTYQPAGIVHKNEYVVPEMVMRDPVAFNHVRVIETIRRDKYGLRSNPLRGYADGGGVDTEVLPVAPATDPQLKQSIDEMNGLLKDLKRSGVKAMLNYSNLKNQSQQIENSINRGSRPK